MCLVLLVLNSGFLHAVSPQKQLYNSMVTFPWLWIYTAGLIILSFLSFLKVASKPVVFYRQNGQSYIRIVKINSLFSSSSLFIQNRFSPEMILITFFSECFCLFLHRVCRFYSPEQNSIECLYSGFFHFLLCWLKWISQFSHVCQPLFDNVSNYQEFLMEIFVQLTMHPKKKFFMIFGLC